MIWNPNQFMDPNNDRLIEEMTRYYIPPNKNTLHHLASCQKYLIEPLDPIAKLQEI